MDNLNMEKIEAEFHFYGCTLDDLKKELNEKRFRAHCKKVVEKFTGDVIEAAQQRELTVQTANRINSVASNALNIIKPETIKLLSKTNALFDKHFSIPETLAISEEDVQNTREMDEYEIQCKKEIADLESVYQQQAAMIHHLTKELELYDSKLMDVAETDMAVCDLYENNFTDPNLNSETVENVIRMLKNVEMHLSCR